MTAPKFVVGQKVRLAEGFRVIHPVHRQVTLTVRAVETHPIGDVVTVESVVTGPLRLDENNVEALP